MNGGPSSAERFAYRSMAGCPAEAGLWVGRRCITSFCWGAAMLNRKERMNESRRMCKAAASRVLVDALESRELLSTTAFGFFGKADTTHVVGWAFDPDLGSSPVTIQVKVDGAVVATGTAGLARPDIVGVDGINDPNHGFNIGISLDNNPHTVEVLAVDSPTNLTVSLGTKRVGDALPVGFFGKANPQVLAGWAFDPDSATNVNIVFVMDGTEFPPTTANIVRADLAGVNANARGFSMRTPTHLFGFHTVQAFAVNPEDGTRVLIGTRSFVNNAPVGVFGNAIGNRVVGWVYDPDQPATSIDVIVKVDGAIFTEVTANISRSDIVGRTQGTTNHGYNITLSGLASGSHTVQIFGVDPSTGVTDLIGQRTILV